MLQNTALPQLRKFYTRIGQLVVLILSGLCFSGANAQVIYSLGNDAEYLKQLGAEASTIKDDSARAYAYLKLSLLHKRQNDKSTAEQFLKQAKELRQNSAWLDAMELYYEAVISLSAATLKPSQQELFHADSALSRFSDPESYRIRAIAWTTIGTIYQYLGDEKSAMDAFTDKAMKLAQESKDAMALGKASKSVAIVFMNANQRPKAAEYLEQSIAAMENVDRPNTQQKAELAETYIIAAENYLLSEVYDSAKNLLDKVKPILKPYPASNLYLIYYLAEGGYFDKTKQYPSANISFEKGLQRAKELNAQNALNRLNYAKYKTLSNQRKYPQAANALLDLLKSPMVFTSDKKIYYKELQSTYLKSGDVEKSAYWAEKYITLSDSLHETELHKGIIELEQKYKEAESRKEIAELKAEKEREALEARNTKVLTWAFGILSLCLCVIAIFGVNAYRNNRKLAKQKELHLQQRLREEQQKQQIEVTNALMQGEEKERQRLAIDLHDGLGSRLAGVKISLSQLNGESSSHNQELTSIMEQLDVSSNELRRIARNLMPEALLRLGLETALKDMCDALSSPATRITFEAFDIAKDIPQNIQLNIYRIVQELLTNSVRHAHASRILVQCSQNENTFFITIEDDGKGFDASATSDGIGMSNMRKRVQYLNGKIEITSAPNEGTTTNIEFHVV